MLQPRLDALPPPQRQLWPELRSTPSGFVLYGGTALALRLAHRESEDFDFFSSDPLDAERLLADVSYLDPAEVVRRAENTLTCLVDRGGPVRVSFFGGLALSRVRDPERAAGAGILVASLLDLAATKVQVVQSRASARDYLDVDALVHLSGIGLSQALGAAAAVHGERFNPVLTLKALTFFGDGDLAAVPGAVRARLADVVREVDLESVPNLSAQPGLQASGASS
ncbi:nucleotidyl transferase AbiEii/AbiGii toxin family protein [Candidatus Palauibacter sp.]|uniref:nucleotidyl transferase AbiEii/AbiGii toxin family protein n=1 Tax=Candidatus Palauibacter sp. TaxID=3101350 RepID=UPI003B595B5A